MRIEIFVQKHSHYVEICTNKIDDKK